MPQQMQFVTLFEKAIMQYVILSKAKEGEVTKENLRQVFERGNMRMDMGHFDQCLTDLKETDHIRIQDNKITVTDDGREDVQKVQHLLLEAPQVTNLTDNRATRAGTTTPQNTKTQTTI